MPAVHAGKLLEGALSGVEAPAVLKPSRRRNDRSGLGAKRSRGVGKRATRSIVALSENNRLVRSAFEQVSAEPGVRLNPLVFYGADGVGKSHLLVALAERLRERVVGRVELTSAARFAREYGRAIRLGGLDRFRRRYRRAAALLFDDFEQLEGKGATQMELLHTFDVLYHAGCQVVVAAERCPRHHAWLHPGLRGRLLMGLCVSIDLPSERIRREILREEAARANLRLAPGVIDYLAGVLGGSVEALVEAIGRLRAIGGDRRLDVPAVRHALRDMLVPALIDRRRPERRVLEAVADLTKVGVDEILGTGRRRAVVEARQLAMYLVRRRLGLPVAACARLFHRSPSTITFAERKIAGLLERSAHTKAWIEQLERQLERLW